MNDRKVITVYVDFNFGVKVNSISILWSDQEATIAADRIEYNHCNREICAYLNSTPVLTMKNTRHGYPFIQENLIIIGQMRLLVNQIDKSSLEEMLSGGRANENQSCRTDTSKTL